jgi:hypothetical protein
VPIGVAPLISIKLETADHTDESGQGKTMQLIRPIREIRGQIRSFIHHGSAT